MTHAPCLMRTLVVARLVTEASELLCALRCAPRPATIGDPQQDDVLDAWLDDDGVDATRL